MTKREEQNHKLNVVLRGPRELSMNALNSLKPWLRTYDNCVVKNPEEWPKDYWGMPFPIDAQVYGKTGRIVPRDPSTVLMYNSLHGEGWPFYVGDVVEIEVRDFTRFGVISPVTGEIIKKKELANWRKRKATDPDVYDILDTYESFEKGTTINGTIIARWCYGDEYGERYHILIGERIYRLENEVPAGTPRRCPFMFKLLIGSDLGNEERRKRECFLKSECDLQQEDQNEKE